MKFGKLNNTRGNIQLFERIAHQIAYLFNPPIFQLLSCNVIIVLVWVCKFVSKKK